METSSSNPRTPAVRKRHAGRVRDWRERDAIRKQVWEAMRQPGASKLRAALERVLERHGAAGGRPRAP